MDEYYGSSVYTDHVASTWRDINKKRGKNKIPKSEVQKLISETWNKIKKRRRLDYSKKLDNFLKQYISDDPEFEEELIFNQEMDLQEEKHNEYDDLLMEFILDEEMLIEDNSLSIINKITPETTPEEFNFYIEELGKNITDGTANMVTALHDITMENVMYEESLEPIEVVNIDTFVNDFHGDVPRLTDNLLKQNTYKVMESLENHMEGMNETYEDPYVELIKTNAQFLQNKIEALEHHVDDYFQELQENMLGIEANLETNVTENVRDLIWTQINQQLPNLVRQMNNNIMNMIQDARDKIEMKFGIQLHDTMHNIKKNFDKNINKNMKNFPKNISRKDLPKYTKEQLLEMIEKLEKK